MSKRVIYISGELINGVKLISVEPPAKHRFGVFECPHCGNHFRTQINIIKRRMPRKRLPSCGCLSGGTTHNLSTHKIHNIWVNMISRTTCVKNKCYKNYGGRGIKMCEEWRRSYKSFYDWAINNGYDEKLTMDRIYNDKDYGPNNCRFVTRTVQNRNKRRSIKSKYPNGVIYSEKYDHYYCRITVNKKIIHLGTFKTIEDAVKYRKDYANEHNLIGFYNE